MTKGSKDDALLEIANDILQHHNLRAIACQRLQRLWAGYGHICSIEAVSTDDSVSKTPQSLILKCVTPPTSTKAKDEGHLRKLISYQVEQYFYLHLAPKSPPTAAMAKRLAAPAELHSHEPSISMILTDLKLDFPVAGEKRGMLNGTQVHAALKWLGTFHGYWWKHRDVLREHKLRLPPLEEASKSTGDVGSSEGSSALILPSSSNMAECSSWTETAACLTCMTRYLATRLKEYNDLKLETESEWRRALCEPSRTGKSVAEMVSEQSSCNCRYYPSLTSSSQVAQVLTPSPSPDSKGSAIAPYETLIHGDVKSENLFSSTDGKTVAFYDFQYVGLGLGVCDLAKLFTVSVPIELLTRTDLTETDLCPMCDGEKALLEAYRDVLERESGKLYPTDELHMHWNTALIDWLRFQASWGFWGNTEWLEARGRHILNDPNYMTWLAQMATQTTT
ncbi:hypothetical protein HII31_12717 [Pseudocercospora fuligena]|uniref:Aminoglycoside phosphotransferase domain-containing protein n=1 Tax=Pseudocercospora fuligena TaxID=685502 RepID=A0A8H6R665_9PEZI|nr:hypothetical protein HII31_12717 [Pseudocercospora fuligena]